VHLGRGAALIGRAVMRRRTFEQSKLEVRHTTRPHPACNAERDGWAVGRSRRYSRAMTAIRIACVGHAALDDVFEVDAFPARPTKTPASSYRPGTGGMAFNAAIAAARLGAAVRMIGRVGSEPGAQMLRGRLRAEGVEARGLESVPGATTSVSAIVVDARGERQIFNHRGDAIVRAHALDTRLLQGADVVLADPRWVAGAAAALRWARAQRVTAMLDVDVAPAADLQQLVGLAQWAVFSAAGLAAYAPGLPPQAALQRALASGCEVAMVTRGDQPVWWLRRGGALQRLAVPRVAAVDTTGAGDVFHAALALAVGEGRGERAAVAFAATAAALKCLGGPGVLGAPRRTAVERALPSGHSSERRSTRRSPRVARARVAA
jgi:sulfofructose kinase